MILEILRLRASSSEGALQVASSAWNSSKAHYSGMSHQEKCGSSRGWQGLMDELLDRPSLGFKHTEGINILIIVHLAVYIVLLVQPVLQRLECFFSWALIFVHHLRVGERDV